MSRKWYLHVDLDAFFASVEQLDFPEYRGKPLIVGGLPGDKRSVVSTASYEARKYGVHSAMPTSIAYRLCPQGIFVRGRMKRYAELSYKIMSIFKNYSPDVQQMSIDEAFIDLTGTEKLFGPPEETAKKLKKEVKEKTGLTVSVGLASSKYLAKIASGISKPDGLYVIKSGEEESFMLNLPLNKVWGLGQKSLELLRKKAINSTRDIYNLPYENLEFLFGKNMAGFLYAAVRGKEMEAFNTKAKSHSISSETTFPEDIIDTYTAETKLLELAQDVMFRLLKEGGISKTVMIKIRYNDFSTFSVQETQDSPISTIDSFYEIAKRLFSQKYTEGRGIRLLGLGLENISKEQGPVQQQLFEDKQKEKKEKVEQTILKMKLKNPGLNIQKARTLKAVFLALFIGSFFQTKAYSSENVITKGAGTTLPDTLTLPQEEEKASLYEWDISDSKHVEFSLEGYWAGEFSGGAVLSWSPDKIVTLSGNLPLYKQEVELSLNTMLNNHWYFSADFADSFTTNTLTAGYTGEGFVRSVIISNRNITMNDAYSAKNFGFSISGGQNQAPGISATFKSPDNRHEINALLRYDVTSAKSAVFYGMNSVSDNQIKISDFAYGRQFIFPESEKASLQAIKNIYVENKNGTYRDENNKLYKKISDTEYRLLINQSCLSFSENAGTAKNDGSVPTILITFTDSTIPQNIMTACGSYDDADSFLGKIQEEFNKAPTKYSLKDYSYPLTKVIEGENALVIQNSYGFSPFLNASLYSLGLNSDSDLSIIYSSSEKTNDNFIVEEYQNNSLPETEDIFKEEKVYAKVKKADDNNSNLPFAATIPEIYLNLSYESDLVLLARTYSPVTSINIGSKAASGSIQVYKNGSLEHAAYDSSSGNVELSSSISQTDKIVILWQEEDTDFSSGTITSGLGYNFAITDKLHTDLALTSKIPVSLNKSPANLDSLEQGFTALSGGITYKGEKISLEEKAAAAVQQINTAGKLLVCQQPDSTSHTYYLGTSSGYSVQQCPEGFLEEEECTVKNFFGLSDSKISGYKVPLRWDFSTASKALQRGWAAVDIKLQSGSSLLNSSQVKLAVQADLPSSEDSSKYELYVQLGVHAGAEKYGEDSNLPMWKIEDFDFSSKEWQTITLDISEKDRARLLSNHDARIIITGKSGINYSDLNQGTIFVGPYEIIMQSIYTYADDDIQISTSCHKRTSKSFSSKISWTSLNDAEDAKDKSITAVSYFKAADFSDYKAIEFTFAFTATGKTESNTFRDDPALTFILDADAESAKEDGKLALKISLNDYSDYINDTINYHTIRTSLESRKVYIDGIELNSQAYTLYINKDVIPSREKLEISLNSASYYYARADFYVDNLIYSESDYTYSLQNYFAAEYKEEKLLSIKDIDILKDADLKISSNQFFSNKEVAVKSDLSGGITAGTVRFEADTSAKELNFYKAGHKIETKTPVFNILTFKENYRYNKEEIALSKEDSLKADFSTLTIPLQLSLQTLANSTSANARQKANAIITSTVPIKKGSLSFTAKAEFNQKINLQANPEEGFDCTEYFSSWKDISTLQFSTGSEKALIRQSLFSANAGGTIPIKNIKLSPQAEYNLKALYSQSAETFTDKTGLKFSLPFATKFNSLTFIHEKIAEGQKLAGQEILLSSYITDSENIFALQNDRSWFYTQIPFYDFFDPLLSEKINSNYSSKYEVIYSRKLFNSINDLFIPSSVKFSASRIIEKSDCTGDLYQFKSTISNTSINLFGKEGLLRLFSWFNQDELYSNFSSLIKVPLDIPENTKYQISWYIQDLFYINSKSFISSGLELYFENDNTWHTKATFIYTRPSKDSLSYLFTRIIYPKIAGEKVNIERKNSINLEIGLSDGTFKQKYDFNHSANMIINKIFTITSGIELSYTQTKSTITSNNMAINASIGAKAEF